MNTTKKIDLYAAGMAIFAMFFGAGNIIFPLALGQFALDKTPYALIGLLITAVVMPFAGLLTMFLYKGQINTFFGRIGKTPGFLLACFTIALLGPLGCAPRCIALAHSTLSMSFSGISLLVFSSLSCIIIFLCAYNKGSFLKLLGYALSPFKIVLLVSIIFIGFINLPEMVSFTSHQSESSLFFHGVMEGYNTMDLIGSFFFAPVIIASLSQKDNEQGVSKFILKACGIGAFLLATVYIGFCYLAYIYASELVGIPNDRLLGAIAIKVLGSWGGVLVSLTVAVTCLTTAIALLAAFSSFVQKEIFSNKVGYTSVLIGSLALTFAVTMLGFEGIAAFVGPVLQMSYPILIGLTAYNLIHYFFFKKRTSITEMKLETGS